MKVRVQFHFTNLVIFYTLLLLCSCAIFPRDAEDLLLEQEIDEKYFASLIVCEQVQIYAQISPDFVDPGHFTVLVPSWMKISLGKNTDEKTAFCIAEEGERLLELLSQTPANRKTISLSIHALIYLAYDMDLFDEINVRGLILDAVCDSNIWDPFSISLIYYTNRFPEDLNGSYSLDSMQARLCPAE